MEGEGKNKGGRPRNPGGDEPITFKIPRDHYDYLCHLVAMGRLGTTQHDAARHIVIRELDAMLKAGYHKELVPRS